MPAVFEPSIVCPVPHIVFTLSHRNTHTLSPATHVVQTLSHRRSSIKSPLLQKEPEMWSLSLLSFCRINFLISVFMLLTSIVTRETTKNRKTGKYGRSARTKTETTRRYHSKNMQKEHEQASAQLLMQMVKPKSNICHKICLYDEDDIEPGQILILQNNSLAKCLHVLEDIICKKRSQCWKLELWDLMGEVGPKSLYQDHTLHTG